MNKNPFAIALTVVVLALAVWALVIVPQMNQVGENATSTLAAAVAVARDNGKWVNLGEFSYYQDRMAFKPYEPSWSEGVMRVFYQPLGSNPANDGYAHSFSISYEQLDSEAEALISAGGNLKQISNFLALVERQMLGVSYGSKIIAGKPVAYLIFDDSGVILRAVSWLTKDQNKKIVRVDYRYLNFYGSNRIAPSEKDIERAMSSAISRYQSKYPNQLTSRSVVASSTPR